MYLLDTNVISESRRPRPSTAVRAWLEDRDPSSYHISSVTFGELWRGAQKATGRNGDQLRVWLETDIRAAFHGRILSYTEHTAGIWGALAAKAELAGQPRPLLDSLIAATAVEHGLSIVTRNIADFSGFGIEVIDPWVFEQPAS